MENRKSIGSVVNRVAGGAMTASSGGVGGVISGVGGVISGVGSMFSLPMALVAGLATVTKMTDSYQRELSKFSVSTQQPMWFANILATGLRDSSLGLSSSEAMDKISSFTPAAGRIVMGDELYGLIGAQLSRSISDQQISQLLSIQRYSGGSSINSIAGFEDYLRKNNQSIVKLPEILTSYLQVANQILQKTGRIDSTSLQQTMMSIGKSYGVEGINLDRLTNNLLNVSGSGVSNPVLRSIQMETLRSLYPNMSTWQMQGILENPTQDPNYMKAFIDRAKNMGGGGDWTKFFLMSSGFGSFSDIEKITKNNFNLTKRPVDSEEKEAQDRYYYYQQGSKYVGSLQKLGTDIGAIKDHLLQNSSLVFDLILGIFGYGGSFYESQTQSIQKGVDAALKQNNRP